MGEEVNATMRFIVPGSIAVALPPSLVPCFRGLGLARFDSLGLIALGFVMAMTWNRSLLPTANCQLTSHFSLLLPMAIRLASLPSQPVNRRHP
jgi:hypothetical protein